MKIWHTIVVLLACIAPVTKAEFVALEASPQTFSKIELGLICPSDSFDKEVNRIAWTVVPVTDESITTATSRTQPATATILTQPANLVDAVVENDVLKFRYNAVSLMPHATGTGVKIQIPADQITQISTIGSVYYLKVHSGFTKLKQINSNAIAVSLHFAWDNDLLVNFEAAGSAISATILGDVGTFNLSGNAHVVQIEGDVVGGTISTNAAAITIDGTVREKLVVNGLANAITAADCSNVEIQRPWTNICYPLRGVTLERGPWTETLNQTRICGSGD